ncbi:MAG: Ig-like domain-containing protein [Treponemataceae bacterium]|nr:Ig-like domain-containing protein [Treponemataceae bacterium]
MSSKYKNSFFIKACLIAGCVLFAFSLFTCTPGLGNQVDTRSPTVTIVSPATKSTLNGSFTVSGTASDDLAVTKTLVTFKNIDTNYSYGPFTAKLSNDTWSLDVSVAGDSSSKSALPDGDYNVTIAAYDASNHVTTADVVYTIDTTPPTVLLTAPATYATTPQFSQTITIKGEVYDRTTLQSVYVYIYDCDGNIVESALAEGTNTFIATFSSPNLKNYDTANPKTVYYYTAVATDAGGNKNNYDFHRCDIASLVANHSSEGAIFPSINALGSLDQGTATKITGGITADEVETKRLAIPTTDTAQSILSQYSYPDLRYTATFNGSITWQNVSERSDDDSTYKSISPEMSVYGIVNPSIDGSSQSGFRVWLKKLTLTDDGSFDFSENIDIDSDGNGIGDNEISVSENSDDIGHYQAKFSSDGNGSFNFTISSGDGSSSTSWQTGYWWAKIYYVTDTGGCGESETIFNVQSGTPNLDETNLGSANDTSKTVYVNTAPIVFSGKATNSDGSAKADSVKISYKASDNSTGTLNVSYDGSTYLYTASFAPEKNDTYEFTLTANVGELTKQIYRTVVYDSEKPVIEVKSVSPAIDRNEGSESYYVNGDITAIFTIADEDQIASASYSVVDSNRETIAQGNYSTSVKKITISGIDTTKLTDEQLLSSFITITATDRSGNTATYTGSVAEELKLYTVYQPSDKPKIEVSNLLELENSDSAGCFYDSDEDSSTYGQYVEYNVLKKSESVSMTVSDDDSVANVYVSIDDGDWTTSNFNNADFSNSPTSKQVKYLLSGLSYGKHTLKFRVEDENYKNDNSESSDYTPYSYFESDEYYIIIDDSSPSLGVSTLLDQNVSSSFEIAGTAKDENGISKVEFISFGMDANGNSDETEHVFYTIIPEDSSVTTSSWAWSINYDLESSSNEAGIKPYPTDITVKVTDGIGRVSTSVFTYYYDSLVPEMPVLVDDPDAFFYGLFLENYVANTTNSLTIKGSISDAGSGTAKSGINNVQWGLLTGKFEHTSAICVEKRSDETCYYYDSLLALQNPNGPQLSESIPQGGQKFDDWFYYAYLEDATYRYYFCYHYEDNVKNAILKLLGDEVDEGEYDADAYSSSEVEVNWTDATLTPGAGGVDYYWKIYTAFPELADGSYTIVIRAIDKVGHTSYPIIHSIVADNTAPSVSAGVDLSSATTNSTDTLYTTRSATLTGTITEENPLIISTGLEYIRSQGQPSFNTENAFVVTCKDSAGELITDSATLTLPEYNPWYQEGSNSWNNQTWSWGCDFTTDGTYTVTILAKDKAYYENTPVKNSATLTRYIIVDNEAPSITLNAVSPLISYNGADTVNGDTTVSVLVKDSNIDSAYVIYGCTKTYADGDWAIADAPDGDFYDSNGNSKWVAFTNSQLISGWSGTIDTTDSNYYYTVDGKNYLNLAFKAVDKSGNVTYKQVNYVVDQNSDKPTISATNLSTNVQNSDDVGYADDPSNSATNVFTASNNIITFNLADDDGLKYVYIAHGEDSLDENTSWTLVATLDGSTSKIWNYTLDSSIFNSYGKYIINFKVVDVNGISTTSYATYTNYIAYDDGAPTLTLNSTSDFVPQSLNLAGSVEDGNGISKIKIVYGTESDGEYTEIDYSSTSVTSANWESEEFTLTRDSGTIYVYAYDKLGHISVKEKIYTVDTTSPILSLEDDVTPTDEKAYVDYGYVDSSQTLNISGVLVDPTYNAGGQPVQASGVSAVRYEITSSETHGEWTQSTGSSAYSFNSGTGEFLVIASFSDTSSKTQYVHIAGCDIAGNWSNIGVAKVSLDTEAPQTTLETYIKGGETLTTATVFNQSVTFKGTATDDAELSSITAYNYNSGSIGNIIGQSVTLNSNEKSWSINFNVDKKTHANDGTYVILFRVLDESGKYTDYTNTYKIDTTAPKISFEATDDITASTKPSAQKITVAFTDAVSGLLTLDYQFQMSQDAGNTWRDFEGENASGTESNINLTSGTISRSLADFLTAPNTDALWRLNVTATDNAGNSENYFSDEFWVDQTKPYMKNTTTLGSVVSIDDSFSISGYIYDYGYGKIESVVASIYHEDYAANGKEFEKTFIAGTDGGLIWDSENNYYTFTWTYDSSNSPFLYDGTYTITILGYDGAGNEREISLSTSCDNDPPEMSFTRPYAMTVDSLSKHSITTGNSTDVMGTITVAGTVPADGESGGMGQIYYQLGKSGAVSLYNAAGDEIVLDAATGFDGSVDEEIALVVFDDEAAFSDSTNYSTGAVRGAWMNTGGTTNYNWSFEFTALNIVNNGFADNRTDENGNATENLWTTYVYVVAEDLAGNINIAVYPINIDIDTDKPTVTILSPDPDSNSNEYGGSFTIMGSATDDNGLAGVYMQVQVVDGNYVNGVLTSTVDGSPFPSDFSPTWINLATAQSDFDGTSETVTAYFANAKDDIGSKGAYTNLNTWYKVNSGTQTGIFDTSSTSATWKLKINNQKVSISTDAASAGNAVWDNDGDYYIFDNVALKNYYSGSHVYSESDQTELLIRLVALDFKDDGKDGTLNTTAVFGEVKEVTVYINAGAPNIDIVDLPTADSYVTGSFDYDITLSDDGYISSYSIIATGPKGYKVIKSQDSLTSLGEISLTGTIDSEELENVCGNTVTITVTALDNSTPINTSTVARKFYIDNTAPTFQNAKVHGTTYTKYLVPEAIDEGDLRDSNGNMRIKSESALVNGWVKDESNGSGIDYVMFWFSQGSGTSTKIFSVAGYSDEDIDANGSSYTATATFVDENDEDVTVYMPVSDLANVDKNSYGISYNSSSNYSSGTRTNYMIVDIAEAGVDYGANGDYDGYNENISSTGIWYVEFDSTMIKDGIYDVNYLVVDVAGNARYFKDSMFVMNHAPTITSLSLKTDLKSSGILADESSVVYVPKRSGSSSSDSYDVYDSELTDDTIFKSVNYLFSLGLNVSGDNVTAEKPLIYYLTYTSTSTGQSKTVTSYSCSTYVEGSSNNGIFWDSTNTSFVFVGKGCDALSASGEMIYTIHVDDYLGLTTDASTITVDMENEDTTNPVGQLLEFNTKVYESFSDYAVDQNDDGIVDEEDWYIYQISSLNWGTFDSSIGHIEPRKSLPSLEVKPTLSGKVWIRGQVLDNQRIEKIQLKLDGSIKTVAAWDSTNKLLKSNNSTTELHQILNQKGHYAEFAYLWDTSSINDVAKVDVNVEIIVIDGNNRTSAPSEYVTENSYRTLTSRFSMDSWGYSKTSVDVRPYITKICSRLDEAYSASPSVFNRSATGVYPVMRGEDIKLYGFNLNGASTTVKFNGTSVGTVTAGNTSDYVTFTVPNTATSGYVDVTVSSVPSLNNSNSTTAEYNLEPNGINNDILTDDRSVYVWGMNDVLTGVSTVRYPSFRIGKDANQTIGFVYDHDGQTVRYVLGNTKKTLDTSFSQWYSTACAVDSSGHIYASAQNGDSGGGNFSSGISSQTGYANYKFYALADTKNGKNYNSVGGAYSQGGNNVALESCIGNGDTFYAERIQHPKIATLGSNTTKMYTVYYDISYPRIVFRYGEASGSVTFSTNNGMGIIARNETSATNARVIDDTSGVGEYAGVGVIPNGLSGLTGGTAVVCWNSGNALKFKYNETPTENNWSDEIVIDADYAGEYCDLAVDAAGGIHIAYYRAGNKLKYAYLSSYKATTADVCMVDSYLSVGENISIETSSKTITQDGVTRYVPYISYYSSAIGMAKVAWPVSLGTNESSGNTNTFVNGVATDKFTGAWEVQVLPTALSTKLLNYTIGVGEKTNGSANSVMLGYGIKTGLQTALLY